MSALAITLGCAAAPGVAGNARAAQAIAPPTRIPSPPRKEIPGTPISTSEIPGDIRRAVVADAAKRFQVARNAVVLKRAERVTWPDAALGCPDPALGYAQGQVPGFRLVAKTTEGELLYHTDSVGLIVNCTWPRPE
jgi:hypothetical protein